MALREIDHSRAEEGAVHRIVAESESLAFAGLLFDIGKKSPSLFAHALKPLFSAGVLWDWDFRVTSFRRTGERNMLGFWGMQPHQLITLARLSLLEGKIGYFLEKIARRGA